MKTTRFRVAPGKRRFCRSRIISPEREGEVGRDERIECARDEGGRVQVNKKEGEKIRWEWRELQSLGGVLPPQNVALGWRASAAHSVTNEASFPGCFMRSGLLPGSQSRFSKLQPLGPLIFARRSSKCPSAYARPRERMRARANGRAHARSIVRRSAQRWCAIFVKLNEPNQLRTRRNRATGGPAPIANG